MGFERTSTAPERIMAYGNPGAGKTRATFSIAAKLAATNSPARIHLVDTDNAYYDMIDETPEADGIVLPISVDQSEDGREWPEFIEAVNRAVKDADPKRGDWIVVDRTDPTWEWVQNFWAMEVKKQSIDDLRSEGREKVTSGKDKNLRAGLQGFEWGEVKSRFRKPYNKLVVSGCNVLFTAGLTTISSYTDSDGTKKDLFGGLPWIPAGGAGAVQIAHLVRDTICLRCTDIRKGVYVASTGKARGRPPRAKLDNEPIKDFAFTVLQRKFGWRVRGNGGGEE